MSEGRQICAYCRTELAADALVCDACGMTPSNPTGPEPPPPGAMTGPALRSPPEPPAVTAPTLLPPPEPPPAPAADSSVLSGRNPLASGAFPAAEKPPEILSGDPLASPPPPPAAPPPPVPASRPPVVPFAATPAPARPPEPEPPPAPPAPDAPEPPAAEDPHVAHPSDETPPGYVTAASLWKISGPRPDWATGDQGPEPAQPPAAAHGEAAAVAPHAPPAAESHLGDTRHSFPALAPKDPPPGAEAPRRDQPPANPNRSRIDGRTAALVAVVVALAAIVTTAVVVLTGGSEPERAAAPAPTAQAVETETPEPRATREPKATPAKPDLDAQVQELDALLRLSKQGRTAAVNGDMKAAIANRSKLLGELRKLDADDKAFQAAVASFSAAIRESLRQNRECASKCSTADLEKVGRLKQAALAKINPLLKAHGGRTYKREEI